MVEGYALLDRIRSYAAFGGVPKYLSAIDTRKPFEQNVIDLLLSPSGEVRLQLETVLSQEEGLREYTKYQGILQTIGIKRCEIGEIAAALGQTLDGAFRRMVGQLVELGFVETGRNFGEAGNQALHYRIADPAIRMYYGLVLPNESAIASSDAITVWRERLATQVFPTYVGQHVFEDIVRQAYLRFCEAKDLPAMEEWGQWIGKDRDRRDVEIDVVTRLLDGRILTGSAKIRTRPADAAVLVKHMEDVRRLAESGRAWAREALQPEAPMLFVSTAGFKPSFREAANDLRHPITLWSVEDLFTQGTQRAERMGLSG